MPKRRGKLELCLQPNDRAPLLLACKIGEEERPANPLEVPAKLAELVLSHQTTKMQANLLSWRENIVLREDALTVASDAALSIHIMVTNRSDPGWVRIVPDRDLSVCPISCLHLRDRQRSIEGLYCLRERGNNRRAFQPLGPTLFHPPNGKWLMGKKGGYECNRRFPTTVRSRSLSMCV